MPRPSAAASRSGMQMQGFQPTVCAACPALKSSRWGIAQVCARTRRRTQDHLAQLGGPQSQDLPRVSR